MSSAKLFVEYPVPVKLRGANQVILNYLLEQKHFVENEKLVRISEGDQLTGFVTIKVGEKWQLAKILGQITRDEEKFPKIKTITERKTIFKNKAALI